VRQVDLRILLSPSGPFSKAVCALLLAYVTLTDVHVRACYGSAIPRYGALVSAAAAAASDVAHDEHTTVSSTNPRQLPAVAHRITSRLWGPGRGAGHGPAVTTDSTGDTGASAEHAVASPAPSQSFEGPAAALIRTVSRSLSRRQASLDRHVVMEPLPAADGGLGSRSASGAGISVVLEVLLALWHGATVCRTHCWSKWQQSAVEST